MKVTSQEVRTVQGKYTFTAEELQEHTAEMLNTMNEKDQVVEEAKTASAQFKNRIAEKELRITALRIALNNGYEMRPYKCIATKNFDSGYKEFTDAITGRLVAKEALTSADYQIQMNEEEEEIAQNNRIADETIANDFQNNESDQLGMVINMKVAEANADMDVFSEPDPFDEQTAVAPDAPETPVGEEITLDDDPFNMGLKATPGQIPREETFKPVEPETPAKVKKVKKDEPDVEGFPFD